MDSRLSGLGLTPRMVEAVVMIRIDGVSYKRAAKLMGLSLARVCQLMQRAEGKIRAAGVVMPKFDPVEERDMDPLKMDKLFTSDDLYNHVAERGRPKDVE